MISRVKLTEKAVDVVRELKKEHGPLLFFQSGGCCEGSQPLLYPIDDFRPGSSDILLGTVEDCPYYMSAIEFKYWKYTQLLIDVVPGVGVGGFSLESTIGYTFVTKSHLFTEDELKEIEPIEIES
ncbi:MAG: DUF779 domain-containing protein [Chitinophagaceae bacterium]